MLRLLAALLWLASLAYPFLWWLFNQEPYLMRFLAFAMAILWAIRGFFAVAAFRVIAFSVAIIFLIAAISRQSQWLLWYPFMVNGLMLGIFSMSLRGMPMIERFARLHHSNLPEQAIPYLRKVTWLWCGFFIFNGSVIAILIAIGNYRAWAIYTGFIAYVLMGALLFGEYIYRITVLKKREGIE